MADTFDYDKPVKNMSSKEASIYRVKFRRSLIYGRKVGETYSNKNVPNVKKISQKYSANQLPPNAWMGNQNLIKYDLKRQSAISRLANISRENMKIVTSKPPSKVTKKEVNVGVREMRLARYMGAFRNPDHVFGGIKYNTGGGSKVGSENYTKTQYNRPAGGKGMFTMPAGALKKIADKFIKRN